jgi:hypothetical protein
VDLKEGSDNVGFSNADPVAALDADLIGNVSGTFLLEDVDTFREITNDLLEADAAAFEPGLYLTLRKDAASAYKALAETLF